MHRGVAGAPLRCSHTGTAGSTGSVLRFDARFSLAAARISIRLLRLADLDLSDL
jgi:hypothetical protein